MITVTQEQYEKVVAERDAAVARLNAAGARAVESATGPDPEIERLRARVAALESFGEKVNTIRNSIVGMQGFNFSEHAYPLVAALNEAGFKGTPHAIAAKNLGTLIGQRDAANARIAALESVLHEALDIKCDCVTCVCARTALLPAPRKESEPVMFCTSPGHRTAPGGGCWDCGRPKESVSNPKCKCGHLKSRHDSYEDHDECCDCHGSDDPCCHYEAALADGGKEGK